jgi:hypothetical protein
MKFGTVVVCSKCKQPIVSGQATVTSASNFPARRATTSSMVGYPAETAGKLI